MKHRISSLFLVSLLTFQIIHPADAPELKKPSQDCVSRIRPSAYLSERYKNNRWIAGIVDGASIVAITLLVSSGYDHKDQIGGSLRSAGTLFSGMFSRAWIPKISVSSETVKQVGAVAVGGVASGSAVYYFKENQVKKAQTVLLDKDAQLSVAKLQVGSLETERNAAVIDKTGIEEKLAVAHYERNLVVLDKATTQKELAEVQLNKSAIEAERDAVVFAKATLQKELAEVQRERDVVVIHRTKIQKSFEECHSKFKAQFSEECERAQAVQEQLAKVQRERDEIAQQNAVMQANLLKIEEDQKKLINILISCDHRACQEAEANAVFVEGLNEPKTRLGRRPTARAEILKQGRAAGDAVKPRRLSKITCGSGIGDVSSEIGGAASSASSAGAGTGVRLQ